jgi:spore germination protein KC
MRRRIKVFITPGEARKLIEFKPPSGETGGRFLSGIIGNQKKNMHVGGARTDLGFISQALDNGNDAMVPRAELSDGILKIGGMAVFRKDQFVDFIDEYTMQGLKFISGTPKSAAVAIPCPEHPWSSLVFEMYIHETILRPHVRSDGGIFFTLDISMWGSAGEIMCANRHNVGNPQFLRQMEQLVAEEVKRNSLHSLQVIQQKRSDLARLGGKMKAYQPKEWKKIKERWGEIYPTVPLRVSVNVVIRGLGEHR